MLIPNLGKARMSLMLDTAEVFDRLSILEVKKAYAIDFDTKKYLNDNALDLMNRLNEFLSYDFARQIYLSDEYRNLFEINRQLFDHVDKAKKNAVSAKDVDDLVYQRHLAKKTIQEKYFGKLEEIKIGY